jgi:hypothetical protein
MGGIWGGAVALALGNFTSLLPCTDSADIRPRVLREHAGGGSWTLLGYPAAGVRLFSLVSCCRRRFSCCSKPPRRFFCCSKPPTKSSPLYSYAVGYLLSCVVNLTAVADHSDWRSSVFSLLPPISANPVTHRHPLLVRCRRLLLRRPRPPLSPRVAVLHRPSHR